MKPLAYDPLSRTRRLIPLAVALLVLSLLSFSIGSYADIPLTAPAGLLFLAGMLVLLMAWKGKGGGPSPQSV